MFNDASSSSQITAVSGANLSSVRYGSSVGVGDSSISGVLPEKKLQAVNVKNDQN